ncbi:MAG: molybdopterin molybdotransferase MoeA [candidate division NC10 bacterium]|nr:molybdopterin molybdotransferase MoeA [candidate division NC10 bacterium]MBI4839873.1 molybdopterin molybdotransferase MoeA [candidate division NC10 bacterium]
MCPSLADARRVLISAVRSLPAEAVPLTEAAARIAQEVIRARVCLPAGDCAAVDGYAVRVADLAGSGARRLPLHGTLTAGPAMPPPLPPGHCMAVMTGALLPPGADAVVPAEAAHRETDAVGVVSLPAAGSGIRRAGAEARPEEILLSPGAPADPRTLERLAGQGITRVVVPRRARVHVIATGDELVPPGEAPGIGQRVASNLPMLDAMVRACGGQLAGSAIAPDEPGRLREALAPSLTADLVLTVGGTLRGSKDLTKAVLTELGATFLFEGVAMRPGSSCAAAMAGSATILCLPGSPGAAFLGFVALGRPLLRALHGWAEPIPAFTARLAEPLASTPEETLLFSGVVEEEGGALEFRRRGRGWPALGILAPLSADERRDPTISVELLPQE